MFNLTFVNKILVLNWISKNTIIKGPIFFPRKKHNRILYLEKDENFAHFCK